MTDKPGPAPGCRLEMLVCPYSNTSKQAMALLAQVRVQENDS